MLDSILSRYSKIPIYQGHSLGLRNIPQNLVDVQTPKSYSHFHEL